MGAQGGRIEDPQFLFLGGRFVRGGGGGGGPHIKEGPTLMGYGV